MERRALGGLVATVVMLIAAAPALAQTGSTGTLGAASDLPPSHGGAAPTPFSYHALHPQELAQAKAGANAKGGGKPGGGGGSTGPTVVQYGNVSPSINGLNQSGLTPPDTTGAIGPDRYIESINTKYGIYNRSGGLINSGTLSALTGVSGGLFGYTLSDPQMMWDAATQRFYYSAVYYDAFLTNMGLAVGWSKTGTPASSSDFCKYTIGFGSELPDYPKLGDSAGFLIYGYNLFGNGASTYDGSEVATLNKPAPGSTCPGTSGFAVSFSGTLLNADGTAAATPVPANSVDDPSTGYVVANPDLTSTSGNSADFVDVYSVGPNGNNGSGVPVAAVTGPTKIGVPSYSIPGSAVQQGSSYKLDTLDGRFEAAVAAFDQTASGGNIAVWTAHAVAPTAGGVSEERWYELNPAGGTPFRSGAVSIPSTYVWNGAISPDRANNGTTGAFGDSMAMSVSTSSSTSYPAIRFVSERSGILSGPNLLVQATGANVDFSCSSTDPCRWGDYSGASPDPAAPGTGSAGKVWLANQYNIAGGTTSGTAWRTWLFAVTP